MVAFGAVGFLKTSESSKTVSSLIEVAAATESSSISSPVLLFKIGMTSNSNLFYFLTIVDKRLEPSDATSDSVLQLQKCKGTLGLGQ